MKQYLKEVGVVLLMGGIVSMTAAGSAATGSTAQLLALATGLGIVIGGMGALIWAAQLRQRRDSIENETPFWIRIVGVFVALTSMGLPYARTPLPEEPGATVEATRTAESFVDVAYRHGAAGLPEAEIAILFFAGVVVVGAFVGIFHHIGGYVIIFGAIGFSFMLVQLLGVGMMELFFEEFQPGVWIALFGGMLIVTSSFLKFEIENEGDTG